MISCVASRRARVLGERSFEKSIAMAISREFEAFPQYENPARFCRAGHRRSASVGALTRARPDEAVAFAILVTEQVRVDRRVEGRIVELEREILAALFRALRPRRPDLGPAHIDAVARCVVVGAVGLRDDPDAPRL